jgi:hypothetical protein
VVVVDQVIVAVIADLETHPIDRAGEPTVARVIVRGHGRPGLQADVDGFVVGLESRGQHAARSSGKTYPVMAGAGIVRAREAERARTRRMSVYPSSSAIAMSLTSTSGRMVSSVSRASRTELTGTTLAPANHAGLPRETTPCARIHKPDSTTMISFR